MTLIVTFPPHPDESGLGYYRRLASMNQIFGWGELASMLQVAKYRTGLLGQPEYVADTLGIERQWANWAQEEEALARSWSGLHRTTHDAVCPACLRESVYLRSYWSHGYATACDKHGLHLVDHCEACGDLLNHRRSHIELCQCGHDLRSMEAPMATPAQRWLAGLLQIGGKSTDVMEPRLLGVDLKRLSSLLKNICIQFISSAAAPMRANASNPKTVKETIELLEPLDELLLDWPLAFERHVEARLQTSSPEARTLNKALGQWYLQIKKACSTPSVLDVFLEAIIRVATQKFDGVLGLDSAKSKVSAVHDHMLLADAAKALGVSRDSLLKGIKSGECSARTKRFGTRGTAYEVPTAEVHRIQQLRGEWVSEDRTCELLVVTPALLKNMRLAGVIESDIHWRNDLYKNGAIRQKSLTELQVLLHRQVQHKRSNEPIVLWSELTSRRLGDNSAIQSFMQAAVHGNIVPVAHGKKLGETAFLRSDVARFFGTPLVEAGTTIQTLSQETGWKWESIAHWIEGGFLEADSTKLRGQTCRVISPQQLLKFRQIYVPLADLAKVMNAKPSSVSERIPGLPVVGAKLLPNGVRRGGLVMLSDLAALAEIGAKATLQQA